MPIARNIASVGLGQAGAPPPPATNWHSLTDGALFERLESNASGLSHEEARRRLTEVGPNEIREEAAEGPLKILARQFTNVLVVVLLAAAVVSAYLGVASGDVTDLYDAALIGAILTMNAVLGFVQEYRAERSLEALRALAAPSAKALRGGKFGHVPSRDLVPGDVIQLVAGDIVPADARVIQASAFEAVEASLTGESSSCLKAIGPVPEKTPLAERRNMVFLGTSVASGRATALVVETGMRTELGAIAGMVLGAQEEATPLAKALDKLGRRAGLAILVLVAVIAAAGFLRGQHNIELLFLTAVGLAVAAIPEGLPAVVTISLAIGLQRMLKKRALVRRLPAVEALGSASVICTDKTGTLTKDEMHVRELAAGGETFELHGGGEVKVAGEVVDPKAHFELSEALAVGLLCNDVQLTCREGRYVYLGDPTEGAIAVAAGEVGLDREALERVHPRVGEIPFTSERKFMATLHAAVPESRIAHVLATQEKARHLLIEPLWAPFLAVKGAPERVLASCTKILDEGEVRVLTDSDRAEVLGENRRMASGALRVLGLARRPFEGPVPPMDETHMMADLTFLGLVGMMDEPRPEAADAVARARHAGIQVVMLTGDHKLTALAVARELGLIEPHDEGLTGEEIDAMDEAAFERAVETTRVFARVSPRHKMRIVEAWRKRGHVVAVTGDGVNDAPALKRADIGVAMGITGTQLAKESSDMVLLDDNFSTIVAAIEEGRGIFENIRKFVTYMLASNAAEVAIMFLATLFVADARYLPFLIPAQLLWINLLTDGLPALALAVDPHAHDLMDHPPRPAREGVLTRDLLFLLVLVAAVMTAGTLAVFALVSAEGAEPARAQTLAFTTIVFSELFFVVAVRSPRLPLWTVSLTSNRALLVAIATSAALQVAVVVLPALNAAFHTAPLTAADWGLVLGVSALSLVTVEVVKAVRARALRPRAARGLAPPAPTPVPSPGAYSD